MTFVLDNTIWSVQFVPPKSHVLMRTNGSRTVGMTDGNSRTIFLSDALDEEFLRRVLIHELCHAVCLTYNIVLEMWEEERLCNFVAEHGLEVLEIADILLNRTEKRGA